MISKRVNNAYNLFVDTELNAHFGLCLDGGPSSCTGRNLSCRVIKRGYNTTHEHYSYAERCLVSIISVKSKQLCLVSIIIGS